MYTKIKEKTFLTRFMPVLRPLLRLKDQIHYLVDRIIFIDVNFISISHKLDVTLGSDILPLGTLDVLWVHPLGLD